MAGIERIGFYVISLLLVGKSNSVPMMSGCRAYFGGGYWGSSAQKGLSTSKLGITGFYYGALKTSTRAEWS